MAKINWDMNDTVKPADLNQIGQEINANTEQISQHKNAAVLDHPDKSVTTAKLADKGVTQAKIGDKAVGSGQLSDGAATDTVIGSRTVSDATAPTADSGTVTGLIGGIAHMIKAITGGATWRTLPGITLTAIKTILDAATNLATASTLLKRDSAGRAKVAAPAAADDIARKAEVDAVQDNLASHIGSGGAAHAAATTSAAGFMSASDKAKLDGVAAGAQVNTVASVAGKTGAVTLAAADIASGVLAAARLPAATASAQGAMSAADKSKLDGIETGANNYTHPVGDGNQHVPATGTGNSGRVLKAGSTAGSAAWGEVAWGEVAGKPSSFAPSSHDHSRLQRIDDRDRKPADITKGFAEFVFTSIEGMTGEAGRSNYQDMIVLNLYTDSTGGKINALVFDKSNMVIRHYQAAQDATTWGIPRVIAYLDQMPTTLPANGGNADTIGGYQTSETGLAGDSWTVAVRNQLGNLHAQAFVSKVPSGTQPLWVDSTTLVANLNVDMVDGYHLDQDVRKTASPTFAGLTTNGDAQIGTSASLKASMRLGLYAAISQLRSSGAALLGYNVAAGTDPNTMQYLVTHSTVGGKALVLNSSGLGFYATTGSVSAGESFAPAAVFTVNNVGDIGGNRFISTQPTGVAPFSVLSTTLVTNLNVDKLDGLDAIDFGRARGGLQFGGAQTAMTTSEFIAMLTSLGAFDSRYWVARGSWSYANNRFISDTGVGNIHLAGCTVEVISQSSDFYTIRIITPSASSNGVVDTEYVYAYNGSGYASRWRKQWNDKNDGAGSGLDSDLLDGQEGSYYQNASNLNAGTVPAARLPAATTSIQGAMSAADKAKLDGIAAGANNYTHPATHPASIITQDANNRFVTDAEKQLLANRNGYGTTAGTSTAYTLSLSPVPTLVEGLRVTAKLHVANGANATINVNGLGAKAILRASGVAVYAGALKANSVYTLVYNGSAFILQGEGGEVYRGTIVINETETSKSIELPFEPILVSGASWNANSAGGGGITWIDNRPFGSGFVDTATYSDRIAYTLTPLPTLSVSGSTLTLNKPHTGYFILFYFYAVAK